LSGRRRSAHPNPRRGLGLLPVVIALGASCGVAPPPPSPIAVNACPPDSCAAYQQPSSLGPATCSTDTQQCTSSLGGFDFTLLVSFPATPFSGPGATVAIPELMTTYLSMVQNACVAPSCALGGPCLAYCARIPVAVQAQGSFVVAPSVETCAGREAKTTGASLPVEVQFWPLWPPTSTFGVAASSVGLPFLPVSGRACVPSDSCVPSGFPVVGGPGGTPGTIWNAELGPGLYEEDLIPEDSAYPPERLIGTISSAPQDGVITGTDECGGAPPAAGETTFTVTRGSGTLDGFSVYFQDATTLRRISSVATLPDTASASVTLLTIGQWGLTSAGVSLPVLGSVNLVVSPPAGAAIPTYIDTLLTPQVTLTPFPALPDPVTVSGTVLGPDQKLIDADLVIESTPPTGTNGGGITICVDGDCRPSAAGSSPRPLTYSTTTHAAGGTFSVVLPPGDYSVFIVPAPGVAAGAGMSVGPPLGVQVGLPSVAGKTQVAPALATISGVAQLSDGRALVGATVEAHAAAQLAATGPPPDQWPRTASTITDDSGAFSLAVDPGTYDVVVRPADGSGFPWMTASNRSVASGQVLSFAPFVVPAPIAIQMTLDDQQRNPVAGAVVRAFWTPPGAAAAQPQVEIGAWLTDSEGSFSMFIAPPE
jgi:hypothetical protein